MLFLRLFPRHRSPPENYSSLRWLTLYWRERRSLAHDAYIAAMEEEEAGTLHLLPIVTRELRTITMPTVITEELRN